MDQPVLSPLILHVILKKCVMVLGSKYNRKDAPFDFFPKEIISREARAMYIDPDLKKVELEQWLIKSSGAKPGAPAFLF